MVERALMVLGVAALVGIVVALIIGGRNRDPNLDRPHYVECRSAFSRAVSAAEQYGYEPPNEDSYIDACIEDWPG